MNPDISIPIIKKWLEDPLHELTIKVDKEIANILFNAFFVKCTAFYHF